MKRFAIPLSALLAALLLLPAAAQAARDDRYDDDRYERRSAPPPPHRAYRDDGGYVVFKGGLYSPQSDDLDSFDSGFSGEVALGKQVAPNLSIEGAIGYFRTEEDFVDAFGPFTATVESVPFTLTARLHTRAQQVEPYLLLGAGVFFNKTTIEDDLGFTNDQSSASAGAQLGGGVNLHLSPTAFLSLETKYHWATAEDLDGTDVDIDGFRTMIGLGIKF